MRVLEKLSRYKLVPELKLLEVYPPFFFMGVRVKSVSKDYRRLVVQVPLRWYGKNMYGSMFGGFICAVADPLPALLCGRIFKGVEMWTKSNNVDFLKPAFKTLQAEVVVTDEAVNAISKMLESDGRAAYTFEFFFCERDGKKIAKVENTIYLRKR